MSSAQLTTRPSRIWSKPVSTSLAWNSTMSTSTSTLRPPRRPPRPATTAGVLPVPGRRKQGHLHHHCPPRPEPVDRRRPRAALPVGDGPVAGGGLDVDEVADGAAVGESADLGADHVVEGEDGAVGGLGGRGPERLLEDVHLAFLAGDRVAHKEPAAESVGLDVRGPPAAPGETCREGGDDLVHQGGVLGDDIKIATEAFDQTVGLHGVSAGEDRRLGRAEVEDVGEETLVERRELHAAVTSVGPTRGSSGKASSQTSRI